MILTLRSQVFGLLRHSRDRGDHLLVLARATNNLGAIANVQGDRERALAHEVRPVPVVDDVTRVRKRARPPDVVDMEMRVHDYVHVLG